MLFVLFLFCNITEMKLNVAKRTAPDLFVSAGGVQSESCAQSRVGNEEARALSSCSSTTLWPFHADDWFRCGERGEERSGSGLCPLITLHYRTGGIYHQTPKASVQGEHWNQSLRLHAIHPGPRKAALWSATTSIFSGRGGEEGGGGEGLRKERKQKSRERRGEKGFKGTLGRVLGNCWRMFLSLPCSSVIDVHPTVTQTFALYTAKKSHKIL